MLLFFLNVSKTVELCRKNAKPMLGPLMEAVEIFDNFRYIYVRFGDQTLWRARHDSVLRHRSQGHVHESVRRCRQGSVRRRRPGCPRAVGAWTR